MPRKTLTVSQARGTLPELVDRVDRGRVTITRHGRPMAVLMSVRESASLDETIAVLEDTQLARAIRAGLKDIRAGRVRDAREVFAEIDAQLGE